MIRSQRLCNAFASAILLAAGAFNAPAQAADATPVTRPGYSLANAPLGDTGIPALVLSKEGTASAKRPAVILLHGGAVVDAVMTPGLPYKEEWFRPVYEEVPYRLADKGMLVVAIDAAWAESRITPETRDEVLQCPLKGVFTYYFAAVQDVSRVIDYLCTRPDVDPGRIGVAGKSGGAITSLMAACQEPRLAAVVSWKGGANFFEMTRLRGQQTMMEEMLQQYPGFRETLEQADPIRHFEKIPPKALALINNRTDPLIPRETAEALHEKLLPLYAAHPKDLMLMLVETKKPTHDDQIEAFDAGCLWLEEHLLVRDSK